MNPAPRRQAAPVGQQRSLQPRAVWLLFVAGAYALLYWLFAIPVGLLGDAYTPAWTRNWIPWFFAPLTLLATALIGRVAATWSLGSYLAGVLVGEVIGNSIYRAAVARLQDQLETSDYQQDWEPTHPGWWICILIFLIGTGVGIVLARRARRVGSAQVVGGSSRAG